MRGRGKSKNRNRGNSDDGFEQWGGYMAAKKAKLTEQFHSEKKETLSNIFAGVNVIVNGLTNPPASEIKCIMAAHGGQYHIYQSPSTTHIIASNLPNIKIKHLGAIPIVKPAWITESIALNKLLDYKRYLLYTNQSKTQPALNFPAIKQDLHEDKVNNVIEENNDKCKTISNNLYARETDTNKTKENGNGSSIQSENAAGVGKITKTASDPKFIEEFYNNSRLHLIATLGAEFKLLVGSLREKSNGKFPGKEKLILSKKSDEKYVRIPDSVIMHIDMDCFFVSVGLRNHPELKGKPVAITHARSGFINNVDPARQASREKEFELYQERLPEGIPSRVVDLTDQIDGLASMSEIASCSYEARKHGIKNGMFLGQAVKLCPELKLLPYDFEGYKEVSSILYNTVASYTLDIEAVSCDEMYVDVRQILIDANITVDEWATHIRNEIMTVTNCPCSTGFGANKLQARLATKKAKPSGQYYLRPNDVEVYMSDIPVADLPGVGRATLAKIKNLGIATCGDLQMVSLKNLQAEVGVKLGEKIYNQAFGKDNKSLDFNHERKSVSAEINYGIRFKTKEECYNFLQSLSKEVFSRLSEIKMRARGLTLKLLTRAEGAPVETAKFLGHGVCDAVSKSSTSNILYTTDEIIYKEAKSIYEKLNVSFAELRGVGIQLTKLEKPASIDKGLANFLNKGSIKQNEIDNEAATVTSTSKNSNEKRQLSDVFGPSNYMSNGDYNVKHAEHEKISVIQMPVKTRGRGRSRGRGSRNGTTLSTNSTMTNFLKKSKKSFSLETSKNQSCSKKMIKINKQIDYSVLNELPEEIQKEILEEYGISVKQTSPNNFQDIPNKVEEQEDGNMKNTLLSPFANLTWEQIKPGIKAWIKTEREPSTVDVDMLGSHLRQLALDRNIEIVHTCFKFLYRVFSTLNCSWHRAYFSLVNAVQQGMVARYGKLLYLKNNFPCCHI
ncbi:rev1 DNA directed polymerase isoform X2 [Rhynchophorus ferrugineus]|uniref:rev1 DNA directed polymerase isoform X2 n=1 Tax=Rhynchophorus ferrugineus TaxID=354439 RepID=UPI003FCD34E0